MYRAAIASVTVEIESSFKKIHINRIRKEINVEEEVESDFLGRMK